ncbi:MAG: hypothetical protein ACREFP_17455 [Acetobacteraceae bacterium]
MSNETAYDEGYASVDANRHAGAEAHAVTAGARFWGPATIKLHLGWLSQQLRISPRDEFRWGRYDALCDLLATLERLAGGRKEGPLVGLTGLWRRMD